MHGFDPIFVGGPWIRAQPYTWQLPVDQYKREVNAEGMYMYIYKRRVTVATQDKTVNAEAMS